MTTKEVADTLVKLCSAGKFEEATKTLYSPDIVSIEPFAPPGQSAETKGLPGVIAKGEWWVANHDPSRPNAVITSSKISSAPDSSHSSRRPCR